MDRAIIIDGREVSRSVFQLVLYRRRRFCFAARNLDVVNSKLIG